MGAGLLGLLLTLGVCTGVAHAASAAAPTISVSPATAAPGQVITVTGKGWTSSGGVQITVRNVYACTVTPDATGVIDDSACTVPQVPNGPRIVSAEQNNNALAKTTNITIAAGITYLSTAQVSPGTTVMLNAEGLNVSSALKVELGSTVLTTSPTHPNSDSNGSITSLAVTIPTAATAGATKISVVDAAGHTASKAVTVYTPKFSISSSSVAGGSEVLITGSGWAPDESTYFVLTDGQSCGTTSDAGGNVDFACTVPPSPAGATTVTGEQNSNTVRTTQPLTVTPAVTYLQYGSASPGATLTVSAEGLTAGSAVTYTLSGSTTPLVTSPSPVTTDTYGDTNGVTVTIPTTAKAGAKTLTVTDAAGKKATASVSVYTPTLSVGSTAGAAGSSFTVSLSNARPNDNGDLYLGNAFACSVNTGSSGTASTICTVPQNVPAGSQALTYTDNADISVSKTFTAQPSVTYLQDPDVTAGASVQVNVADLEADQAVTAKLDGKAVATNPSSPFSDANGSLSNLVMTIPTGTSPGHHTLAISDGTTTASTSITVLTPTITPSVTSGTAQSTFGVTGSGWQPNNTVVLSIGSDSFCFLGADGSGDISGSCTVPSLASGSYPLSAEQDSSAITVTHGTFTIQ